MAASVDSLVGARVSIETDAGKSMEGDVFAYDAKSRVVVLVSQVADERQHAGLHMIKESSIKDLKFLGPGTTNILPAGPLPPVNEHELRAREAHTMRLAQRQASNTNADVPTAVQTLFDRIANTYDCTWRKADIIVMDSVAITPPYTGASVAAIVGGSDAAGLATRIAKVVQGYRAKGGLGADIDAALVAAGPGQPA